MRLIGLVRDSLPRIELNVQGRHSDLAVELVVDTGFDGYLTLPISLLDQLGATPGAGIRTRLANGMVERARSFTLLLEWGDDWQETETIASDGLPLLGMAQMRGCSFYLEDIEDGEAIIESL